MPTQKVMSPYGVELLMQLEGTELVAYKDIAGVWTIASGVTFYPDGRPVKQGDKITLAQAYDYTKSALKVFERAVNKVIRVPLTQNQFDALTLFAYNIGVSAFIAGTVDDKINAGKPLDAVATWASYKNIRDPKTGKLVPSKGLIRRRSVEIELFIKK